MSDRSGVGAPTHDGAEPDVTSSEAAPKNGAARPDDNGDAEATPTTSKGRRRLSRDLFGVSLGAEPAAASPPGVPVRQDDTEATAVPDLDEPEVDEPSRSHRREVEEGVAAPTTSRSPLDDDGPAPEVIDSSVDSGVVPVVVPPKPRRRNRRGGLRARRVHRIVRRVDPWSVLKLSLLFYFCVWLMVVVAGVLLWGVAVGSGTVESVEGFIERLLSFEEFHFNADQIFRLFAMGGLIMVFLATAMSAILAVLFNLISDVIGGIRITVVEEESTRRILPDE